MQLTTLQDCLNVLTDGELFEHDFSSNISNIFQWVNESADLSLKSKERIIASFKLRELLIDVSFDEGLSFSDSSAIYNLLLEELRFHGKEHLIGLCFNANYKLIKKDILSIGSVDTVLVSPRDVFKFAFINNASFIALAQNHPSGDATPGESDIELTKTIAKIGKVVGIRLIDHIIIGKNTYFSMYEEDESMFK